MIVLFFRETEDLEVLLELEAPVENKENLVSKDVMVPLDHPDHL